MERRSTIGIGSAGSVRGDAHRASRPAPSAGDERPMPPQGPPTGGTSMTVLVLAAALALAIGLALVAVASLALGLGIVLPMVM